MAKEGQVFQSYTEDFKTVAVREYLEGKDSPQIIFRNHPRSCRPYELNRAFLKPQLYNQLLFIFFHIHVAIEYGDHIFLCMSQKHPLATKKLIFRIFFSSSATNLT